MLINNIRVSARIAMLENKNKGKNPRKRISQKTDVPDTKNGYISIAQASEQVPAYSAEYLSLRVRQGKLKGKKIGRNWYTKRDWISEYVSAYAAKEVHLLPATPTPRRSYIVARFFRAFNPTRLLAASLTATIVFVFIVPPQVWAHWGMGASLAVTKSFDLATSGSKLVASSLAKDIRFKGPLGQIIKGYTMHIR